MKLSIIIPMYNVEAYIRRCLVSCEIQDISHDEYEIVVINDGSPDRSLAIAEEVANEYSNITIISQENRGLSVARNTGIKKASGDYLFFVDSDDWIERNCLKMLCDKLSKDSPDVLAICAANVKGNEIYRRFSYEGLTETNGPEALRFITSPCAPFFIVKRVFLEKNNICFFSGIFHEDSEYTPRLLYSARKVVYIDEIVYYVYQNPNSIMRTTNSKKVFDVLLIVSPHLYKFAQEKVSKDYRSLFFDLICVTINSSLHVNYDMADSDISKANILFYKEKYLIKAFLRSNIFRYNLEGLFLWLFPKHLIKVYKMMNSLKNFRFQ